MIDAQTRSIIIQRPTGQALSLPMSDIYWAEGRIKDVATVNAHKAPELLAVFNKAYLNINDHLVKLEMLKLEALRVANSRRSVVILDIVPKKLQEKGVVTARSPGGSEDQRQAVLDQDEEYLAAMDRVNLVKACIQLLEGKKEAMEWAFTSVKKILVGEPSWVNQGANPLNKNRSLSFGADQQEGMGAPEAARAPGFGKAKV